MQDMEAQHTAGAMHVPHIANVQTARPGFRLARIFAISSSSPSRLCPAPANSQQLQHQHHLPPPGQGAFLWLDFAANSKVIREAGEQGKAARFFALLGSAHCAAIAK
jgi:hypothetical protein